MAFDIWKNYLTGTQDGQILANMSENERIDAFSGDIAFGTGGLRGIMGLGTNRMNRYTITRVTYGLAKTILTHAYPKSVGIAYDTRHRSAEFAQIVCETLLSCGIDVYIFPKPMPTPMLSFAIRYLSLGWGVVITASHNPREYNGYKVYDRHGIQITDQLAREITDSIESIDYFEVPFERKKGHTTIFNREVELAYQEYIVSFVDKDQDLSKFPFVYSGLHGTGAAEIPCVLKKLGFSPICVQQEPDGDFGGIRTPNPEEPAVYAKALEEAKINGAKLLCATDPDCDRTGVMIKTKHGFELLSGNQLGALLIDYLVHTKGVSSGDTVITTVVSGMLGELLSKAYGLEFKRLLTGFKYIGEYAERLPATKRFFFGYEESYGFLAGNGARDKDAVIAVALIVKMAASYERKGFTLVDRLAELWEKYGYCMETLNSIDLPKNRQAEIITKLRTGIALEGLERIDDYSLGLDGLPPSNVLKLFFKGGGWAAIRPSGTEPKIKLYTGVCVQSKDAAKAFLDKLTKNILSLLLEA
jgi:phosphoglucomutase